MHKSPLNYPEVVLRAGMLHGVPWNWSWACRKGRWRGDRSGGGRCRSCSRRRPLQAWHQPRGERRVAGSVSAVWGRGKRPAGTAQAHWGLAVVVASKRIGGEGFGRAMASGSSSPSCPTRKRQGEIFAKIY
jgi:hypothetical protein